MFGARTLKACKDCERFWQDHRQERKQKAHCKHPTTDGSNGKLVRLVIHNIRLTLKPVGHQSTN